MNRLKLKIQKYQNKFEAVFKKQVKENSSKKLTGGPKAGKLINIYKILFGQWAI